MDRWVDSVSSRYSFCGKSDGWMDGKCKFEIVVVVSQMYVWMDRRMNG